MSHVKYSVNVNSRFAFAVTLLPFLCVAGLAAFKTCPTAAEESPRQSVIAKQQESQYTQGYDATKKDRDNIHSLPGEAWGKVVNGLQAGISAPKRIRLNDVVILYLVVRNVSQDTIRVSLPKHPNLLSVQRTGSSISYSVNGLGGPLHGWELKPGHQADIPSPPFQVLAPGDLGLRNALTKLQPGEHRLYARIGTDGKRWVTDDDGKRRKVAPPKGEWTGWFSAAKRPIEIITEKAPFAITPLEELPEGHGLKYVLGPPPPFATSRTEWIELGDGLTFALNGSSDEHWLGDHGTYNRSVFWGPIPARRLRELNLLEKVKQLSRQYIENARHYSQAEHRIAVLVTCKQPLAEIGLQFIPVLKIPKPTRHVPSDYLARTIRDRRVELKDMGLAEPMHKALQILTQDDPPLPDDSQFNVISSKAIPAGLPDGAWGPENAGLSAAALMPKTIADGATEKVRLFIRNVGYSDVHLAVSERAGYDYATAVDTDGSKLESIRPLIFPSAFSSVIVPEYNPGQNTQNPPTATLAKVLLKPGAVLELRTATALSFHTPGTPAERYVGITPAEGKPAVTYVNSKPTTAMVTWHLHTANGTIYSQDLKRRLWPAQGSWSGLLRTAPIRVQLKR